MGEGEKERKTADRNSERERGGEREGTKNTSHQQINGS